MHILICCATPWELKTVKHQIKSLNLKQNLNLHYLCTWIGNYETIFTLTKMLTEEQKSDFFLLNIGICGYTVKGIPPKVLQIWRIKHLTTQKELLPPQPFEFAKIESIRCSETVITERENEEKGYVDMESWGIERVAEKFRLPRLLIKVPFDSIWEETRNFEKEKACKVLAENIDYKALIEKVLASYTNP